MGIYKTNDMKVHSRELLLFYNPQSSADRKTLAHARGTGQKVISYDHKNSRSTTTIWRSILSTMNKHPKELLNKAHPYYQANIKGKEFDMHGWLNILQRNPDLIRHPIAIKGSKAIFCETPTDVYKIA